MLPEHREGVEPRRVAVERERQLLLFGIRIRIGKRHLHAKRYLMVSMQHTEIIITGEIPSPLNPPSGCRFHPRCPFAKPICSEVEPVLKQVDTDHQVACHLFTDAA